MYSSRPKVFRSAVEFEERPGEEEYTHICKVCWPPRKLGVRELGGQLELILIRQLGWDIGRTAERPRGVSLRGKGKRPGKAFR